MVLLKKTSIQFTGRYTDDDKIHMSTKVFMHLLHVYCERGSYSIHREVPKLQIVNIFYYEQSFSITPRVPQPDVGCFILSSTLIVFCNFKPI